MILHKVPRSPRVIPKVVGIIVNVTNRLATWPDRVTFLFFRFLFKVARFLILIDEEYIGD